MLCLRTLPGLNRCTNLQNRQEIMRCGFKSMPFPHLQRSPVTLLQSRHSKSDLATVSVVGEGASHAQAVPHTPVLLPEVLAAFSAVNLKECQHFVGIDVDPTAHTLAEQKLSRHPESSPHINLLQGNFGNVHVLLHQLPGKLYEGNINGMLLDLGVSSMQVDQAERGFSFSKTAPLDMRMGPDAAASAEQIVNTWSETELGQIFREYGEERHWKGIASRIATARQEGAIRTTTQLVSLIGGQRKSKLGGGKHIHPATRVFQALRIAVNQELQMLEQAIPAAIDCLAPQGRLAIISFHSLEDRIVKRAFLKAAGKGPVSGDMYGPYLQLLEEQSTAVVKLVNKKPITPGDAELKANLRSRSAKLRVVEKLDAGISSPADQN